MVKNNLTGYHGTTLLRAEKILDGHSFIKSKKKTEWLGAGIYFFPDIANAIWWAHNASKRCNDKPAVLSVQLRYFDFQMLDLDKPEDLCKLSHCVQDFLKALAKEGEIVPDFSASEIPKLWCFSCNIYKKKNPQIKLIAYTFETPQETYTGFKYKQRQFCSTDNTIISRICKEAIK